MSSDHEQLHNIESDPIVAASIMPQENIGLGRSAVRQGLQVLEGEKYREEILQLTIENARHALIDANHENPEETAEALELDLPLPVSLKLMLGMDEESEPSGQELAELLTGRNQDFTHAVPDATFANFLDWHNHTLVESQANLAEAANKYRAEYAAAFTQSIHDGWIPNSAMSQLDLLPQTILVVDDGFSTNLKGLNGYFTTGRDGVQYSVVKPHDEQTDFNGGYSRDTVFHEFTHALAGREIGSTNYLAPPSSGLYRTFGPIGGEILNEALTEQQSEAMLDGQIDITDPDDPLRSRRESYREHRQLLHTLCNDGVEPINIRLFSAEYFRNSMPESQKEMHVLGLRIEAMKKAIQAGEDVDFDNLNLELPPEDDADIKLKEALTRAFPFTDIIQELNDIYANASPNQTIAETFHAFIASIQQRAKDYRTPQKQD